MAITDKEQGVWGLDQVYNKINQGSIWEYSSTVTALRAWGRNRFGYLGQNSVVDYSSPVQIPGTTWETIAIGTQGERPFGTAAVKSDGTLWVMGSSSRGSLGNNVPTSEYASSPVQIPGTTWSDGSYGPYGWRMLKTDGTLWGTGNNANGELGQNNIRTPSYSGYSSPVQIPGTDWSQVATGNANTFALRTDGTLWGWGGAGYGVLGQNDNNSARSSPVQVPGTYSVVKMWNGGAHAVRTDGTLWSWGVNYGGQCGQNQTSPGSENSPSQVGSDTTWGQTIDTLGAGRDNALSIKTDGTLWMWGYNTKGQLGQNSIINYSSPVQVGSETTWRSANTNQYTTFATKTDGSLWAWGENAYGQIGKNDVVLYSSPVQIPGIWQSRIGGAGEGGLAIIEVV